MLSKKYQCPLCTRSRCLRSDLATHLGDYHGAKETKGKLHEIGDVTKEVERKYDVETLIELPIDAAICGYDEKHVKIIEKNSTDHEEVSRLVTEMNDYSTILSCSSDSEDSSIEEPHTLKETTDTSLLTDYFNRLSDENESSEDEATKQSEDQVKAEDPLEVPTPIRDPSTEEPEELREGDDNNQEGSNLNIDGSYEIPQDFKVPMESKIQKTLLILNSLEDNLSEDTQRKIKCVKDTLDDAKEVILNLKSNLIGVSEDVRVPDETNLPRPSWFVHNGNDNTISINTSSSNHESDYDQ